MTVENSIALSAKSFSSLPQSIIVIGKILGRAFRVFVNPSTLIFKDVVASVDIAKYETPTGCRPKNGSILLGSIAPLNSESSFTVLFDLIPVMKS